MRLATLLVLTLGFFAAGCNDDGDLPAAPPASPPSDAFATVNDAARLAVERAGIPGMGLAVYDRDGRKVFENMYGDFAPDRRVAIASASKLVSGVVLLRLIDRGYLTLDSTTGAVLGWSGPQGEVTLRHLLSFTSGLPPEDDCTYDAELTLAECVAAISNLALSAPPGTRFDYGSTHLHVAARMAEVAVGASWNSIWAAQLRDALGLPDDLRYYANPLRRTGTGNPLAAGGLVMSMNEYGEILRLVFDRGRIDGQLLVAPELVDLQARAPYPDATIGTTPASIDGVRYGLTAWLECDAPAAGCATISSPGAFGFVPWLDRDAGYYAVLGMQLPHATARTFAVPLQRQLKPLIAAAFRS